MALNLISSYASDSDSNDDDNNISKSGDSTHGSDIEVPQTSDKLIKSCLFGGEEDNDSDDDSEGPSKSDNFKSESSSGAVRRLPSAGLVLKGKHVGSSVFSSERERENLAHVLTLSQHVPLTEKVEKEKKPLCRAFARGQCKRGAKCRYAHPITPVSPQDAVTIDAGPRMYNADDILAKKFKMA
ncbi:hypothetical protein V3C99_015154 [Haemonchus contortus]|uniref:C3H1-type domain-containing protein n=1 Tax=Haemonchus contortus TaxID=6289 RepID=A0A7I4YX16_HAECO